MSSDPRNTRVVAALIAAMTLGAFLLLGLERFAPRTPGFGGELLLTARSGQSLDGVLIDFGYEGYVPSAAGYDCVILPTGAHAWTEREHRGELRILLLGYEAEDRLQDAQALKLLAVLGSLEQQFATDNLPVRLHPEIDPTRVSALPNQVYELHGLLVRKGLIQ